MHFLALSTAAEGAQNLLSHVITLFCVDSVLIYSTNIEGEHFKPDDYPKVFGVFSNFNLLVFKIKHIVEKLDTHLQMRRSFSICKSNKDVIYEFGDFLWFNMLIQAAQILDCNNDKNDDFSKTDELVSIAEIYYRGNPSILKEINDFNMNYRSENAILWYTSLHFTYKLLNKGLRTENLDLLTPFLFFIFDMKKCLAREHHSSPDKETNILYRGIKMLFEDFEKLKQMKGELISMNGFVSTSR